jgi:hypothetical protein
VLTCNILIRLEIKSLVDYLNNKSSCAINAFELGIDHRAPGGARELQPAQER